MNDQTPISTLFPAFRQALAAQDRRPRTIGGYQSDLDQFVTWWQQRHGQPPTLADITPHDVRDYRHQLRHEANLAAPTVNRRLASLRVFLEWAVSSGRLSSNPAARIGGIKLAGRPTPRWLTRPEQQRLLTTLERTVQLTQTVAEDPAEGQAAQAVRDRALVVLLLNTGLRVQELTSLTVADITLNGRSGTLEVREGKGGKTRTLPLNNAARSALQTYLEVRPAAGSQRLFLGQRGPIGSRQVLRLLKKYAQRAELELEEVTVHTLRHTFGKNLVDAGVSLDQVATLMGHANLNTTRMYTTPGRQDLQYAVEKLQG